MLLRIIMYYDPTLSVLLYSIQSCFFLSSSEGSLLFCNFFFGFFLVWIGFTAEMHFSVLSWTLHASSVASKQQRLPRARPLQCERPCWQKSLPLPDLALSFWSLPSGVMGWSCFRREGTASSVASKQQWLPGLLVGRVAQGRRVSAWSSSFDCCHLGHQQRIGAALLERVIMGHCTRWWRPNNNDFARLLVRRVARDRRISA